MKLTRWNPQDHLESQEDIAGYLSACFAEHDANLVVHALHGLVQARGIDIVASAAGVDPEALIRSFSRYGECDLATLLRVLQALGMELHVAIVRQGQ